MFAQNVEGADIETHIRIILKSQNKKYNKFCSDFFGNKYRIISAYYFIDDILDERNNEEDKSMQKRS